MKSNQIKSKSFKIKIKIKIKIETETETKTNLKSKSSQGIFRYLAGVTSPHSADLGQVNGARLRTRAGTCAAENEPLEILGTLHSALFTLQSTLYTLLSTLYSFYFLLSTLYTLHSPQFDKFCQHGHKKAEVQASHPCLL